MQIGGIAAQEAVTQVAISTDEPEVRQTYPHTLVQGPGRMFSYKVRQGKAFSGGSKNTGQENKVVAWYNSVFSYATKIYVLKIPAIHILYEFYFILFYRKPFIFRVFSIILH